MTEILLENLPRSNETGTGDPRQRESEISTLNSNYIQNSILLYSFRSSIGLTFQFLPLFGADFALYGASETPVQPQDDAQKRKHIAE